jgi:hypothetical protein
MAAAEHAIQDVDQVDTSDAAILVVWVRVAEGVDADIVDQHVVDEVVVGVGAVRVPAAAVEVVELPVRLHLVGHVGKVGRERLDFRQVVAVDQIPEHAPGPSLLSVTRPRQSVADRVTSTKFPVRLLKRPVCIVRLHIHIFKIDIVVEPVAAHYREGLGVGKRLADAPIARVAQVVTLKIVRCLMDMGEAIPAEVRRLVGNVDEMIFARQVGCGISVPTVWTYAGRKQLGRIFDVDLRESGRVDAGNIVVIALGFEHVVEHEKGFGRGGPVGYRYLQVRALRMLVEIGRRNPERL